MYIQITDKCNMNCDHCAFACTNKGSFMEFETFKEAIEFEDFITIGGGEPTLHPQIEKFVLYALWKCESVFMVTNGTNKDLSLTLLALSQAMDERFGIEVSQDDHHDMSMVDWEVYEYFNEAERIRNVSNRISYTGRAKEFWDEKDCQDSCVCDDKIVLPDGRIKFCGCDNAPIIGDVWKGIDPYYNGEDFDDCDNCWTNYIKTLETSEELVCC